MVFICRLCGKCENELSGLAIFGEQGVQEAIAYKIKLSLDISVSNIAVTGHCHLKGHLFKVGLSDGPTCERWHD
jgi:hypothetical protein